MAAARSCLSPGAGEGPAAESGHQDGSWVADGKPGSAKTFLTPTAAVQSGAPTGLRGGDQSSEPREPTLRQQSPPVLQSAARANAGYTCDA